MSATAKFRIRTVQDSYLLLDEDGDFEVADHVLQAIREGWWNGTTLYLLIERPTGANRYVHALINPEHVESVQDLQHSPR